MIFDLVQLTRIALKKIANLHFHFVDRLVSVCMPERLLKVRLDLHEN